MIRRDYTKVYTSVIIIFFFQAEDGIRDKLVTGVQTCALPISLAFSTVSAQRVHQGFWISLAPGGAGIVHKEGLAYPLYVRLGARSTSDSWWASSGMESCSMPSHPPGRQI